MGAGSYAIVSPPLTDKVWPVMYPAPSEARNATPGSVTESVQEAIEHLLDRMATLSERIAIDAEEQLRQLNQRAREVSTNPTADR